MTTYLHNLLRLFYWVLPIIILSIIFQRIDFGEFEQNLLKSDPWLVLLGIAFSPATIIIGSYRWKSLLQKYIHSDITQTDALIHYWMGLPLGLFVPGTVGWDLYRIIVMGRRFGHYILNAGIILAEKIIALFVCILIIIILYPIVRQLKNQVLLEHIVGSAFITLVIFVIVTGVFIASRKNKALITLLFKIEEWVSRIVLSMIKRIKTSNSEVPQSMPLRDLLYPIYNPMNLMPAIGLTFAIQLSSAIGIQVFFLAQNYDLPLLINLFLMPIFYIIFLLPITFGTLGVREAAYIVLYGLFGVPAETALLISFYGLAGVLINNAIGGLLILSHGKQLKNIEKLIRDDS